MVEFEIFYSMIGCLGKAHSAEPILSQQTAAGGDQIPMWQAMGGIISADAEILTAESPHQSNDKGNQLAIENIKIDADPGALIQDDIEFPAGHASIFNGRCIRRKARRLPGFRCGRAKRAG